ncbi:hypothetical protein KC356_g154 [Hortaea werneckii]|nr:hypothetical protein KC356_g154 [Hortaea werneckii]
MHEHIKHLPYVPFSGTCINHLTPAHHPPEELGAGVLPLTGVFGLVRVALLLFLFLLSSFFTFSVALALASVNTAGGVGAAFSASSLGLPAGEFEADAAAAAFASLAFCAAASSSALRFLTAAVEEVNLNAPGSPRRGFSSVYSSPN